jgi:hypothetical protein
MGYVDRSEGGFTELRVHGVSGTPPEAMLFHPHAYRVAGDSTTGFYRRMWDAPITSEDDASRRLEAYSWGGLTSGGWTRALWLLLVPFMLVNVAFFMTPFPFRDGSRPDPEHGVRRIGEAAQRILALALTVTMVLAAAGVFLDLLAWQCGLGANRCTSTPPLGLLVVHALSTPSRRLALGALAVLAVVALLGWLGRSSWRANETVEPPAAVPEGVQEWCSPLESRDFWRGGAPVLRLRRLHLAAALGVVALLTAAPLQHSPTITSLWRRQAGDGPGWWLPAAVVTAALVLLAACLLAAVQPSLSDRVAPDGSVRSSDSSRVVELWLLLASVVVVAAADVVAWGASFLGVGQPVRTSPVTLPWFAGVSGVTFVVEACAVALLGLAVALSPTRRALRRSVPWRGLAAFGFALLAWALAGGFAVALQLWVAGGLGYPAPEVAGHLDAANRLLVPLPYFWGGAAFVCALAAAVVAVTASAILARRDGRRMVAALRTRPAALDRRTVDLTALYPDLATSDLTADAEQRAARVAWMLALGRATDTAIRALGWLFAVASFVVVAAAVLDIMAGQWIVTSGSWLSGVGSWVLAFAAAAFFGLAVKAYDTPSLRRSVGIAWDLGTFWPRATHPLAPPCYTERAVPELLERIEFHLTPTPDAPRDTPPRLLLSCHSQGTVIGAAVVAASTYSCLGAMAFLTYGCPLRRLYARFFPVYFGDRPLRRLGELLQEGAVRAACGADAGRSGITSGQPETRRPWPWINLYRVSDPIGGWVFEAANAPVASGNGVDRELVDPGFARALGDPAYPRALGHSDYWLDPLYQEAIHDLVASAPGTPGAAPSTTGRARS